MTDELRISDHALVRYMERVKGLCLDEYRQEIREMVEKHQNEPMPEGYDNGIVIVIESLGPPIVTTILGHGQRPKRKNYGVRLVHIADGAP